MTLHPITHVAIRFRGEVFALPAPCRHHHVLNTIGRALTLSGVPMPPEGGGVQGKDQGFVDASGAYLDREEAYARAGATGQLKGEPICPGTLFSEDLW